MKKKRKGPPSGLKCAIERLTGTVGMLQNRVNELTNIMGRTVFPAEAMEDLIGELRALRHVLDKDGIYAFVDRARITRDRNRAKEATAPDGKPEALPPGVEAP